jgi:flagellar basal body-associated protein FliL
MTLVYVARRKKDENKCEEKSKLSGGAIAGIVIGVIIFLAGAGVGGYFLYKHLSKKKKGKKAAKSKRTKA